MKKIIVVTLILITLIIASTGMLVTNLKKDLIKGNTKEESFNVNVIESGNINEEVNSSVLPKEKTLNLYGTYKVNNLNIIDKEVEHELLFTPVKMKQISGLKDKQVEDKINKDIEDKLIKALNEFSELYGSDKIYAHFVGECANFSNVLSIPGYVNKKDKNGNDVYKYLNLNYNLITGEELEFKDLFNNDADFQTMFRKALYIKNAERERDARFWEEMGSEDEIYILPEPYTDDEINQIVKETVACEEFEFVFTQCGVTIFQPEELNILFEDFADMVTVYDKYLTEESLYDNNSLDYDLIACSREKYNHDTLLYKKAAYESENFFYDITIESEFFSDKSLNEYIKPQLKESIKMANSKVEYFRELARNNPDKMYVVYLYPVISAGRYWSEYYNLVSINFSEKIISGDIAQKDDFLYKIFNVYRYPNLYTDVYGGIAFNAVGRVMYDAYNFESLEQNHEYKVYDWITGKELKELKEIFKDGVDYKNIIKEIVREENKNSLNSYLDGEKYVERTEEEIEAILENMEYEFDSNYIYPILKNEDGTEKSYFPVRFFENLIWENSKLQEIKKEDFDTVLKK